MNIFTYGSLMIPSIFGSVTGKEFKSRRAHLSGYERFSLKFDSYPGIIESSGHITDGLVYLDVDDVSIQKLDTFEGGYYRRTPVQVSLCTQTAICAETYVIKKKYRHILSTRPWDFEEFKNKFQNEFRRKYFG